jgi:transposase
MGKPHPIELRERVVLYVDEGYSHRETARVFSVSVSFVNNMIKLRRKTGSLAAKKQGNPGKGKLSPYEDWVRERLRGKADLTLDELRIELHDQHGLEVHRASIGYWLHRLGLSNKKNTHRRRAEAS